MKVDLLQNERFITRHNGSSKQEIQLMLQALGYDDLSAFINHVVPENIRLKEPLKLPTAQSEHQFLEAFKSKLAKNKTYRSYIGAGYYGTITPPVILRNILENPGWYTAYTPYQAEIAQGRLEALINFQTLVTDLTAMDFANASLLDEATAAAEAMCMFFSARKGTKKKEAFKFFVDKTVFPQTLAVLKTRAKPLGIDLHIDDRKLFNTNDQSYFGILLQYPDGEGLLEDYQTLVQNSKHENIQIAVAADILSLTLLKPPGEWGADVVLGSTQRFGVPMGFGGPHAAYFAFKEQYKRLIPGRIIGVSVDKNGKKAYRMALQTREQHIRREKATSNICTAQVLLAVIAGAYAIYHGADGLKNIAAKIHGLTKVLNEGLLMLGYLQENSLFFDTLKIFIPEKDTYKTIQRRALDKKINFRYYSNEFIGISLNETTTFEDVITILNIFDTHGIGNNDIVTNLGISTNALITFPAPLKRNSSYLNHPVFSQYRNEHEMLRYLKKLENKDLSLVHSMISLGSCTMKLNATSEMIPVTWPEVGNVHPFSPEAQTKGYLEIIAELETWLNEITGFYATSFQPNSGAQGEFAGLMVINAYHKSRGDQHRNIAIIPTSAHGTNPASAVMAGMKVVLVKCDEKGNIDVEDLQEKINKHQENLAALMVTYPSTHGVFESSIQEVCKMIHEAGGKVYMDGANMNAQVGLTSPANIGADVCHLNLHKTFCIPHGGGGPGMGPICCTQELSEFLPSLGCDEKGGAKAISNVSAAAFGSASILTISYAYIAMMGQKGLKKATELAILNANYIKYRLEKHYQILYKGEKGNVAHEMIIDCRTFKKHGVEVEDIAKRLMDYGFHAPTVSFPVVGTLMIEPTESESKEEIDRFCDAMISIRKEINDVIEGKADKVNNLLKNAPHIAEIVMQDAWDFPYSRQEAAYPLPFVKANKFWPSVSRIDSAFGDRNLFCACIPVEDYES